MSTDAPRQSRRLTGAPPLEVEIVPKPRVPSVKTEKWSFTEDEEKELAKFFKAYRHYYRNTDRYKNTIKNMNESQEEKAMRGELDKIYGATRAAYNLQRNEPLTEEDAIKKEVFLQLGYEERVNAGEKFVADEEWIKICLKLLRRGLPSKTPLFNYFDTVLESIHETIDKNYNLVNTLPLPPDVRHNIYKNFTYQEFLTAVNKSSISELTNEEKVDLLASLNNPTSKMFTELLESIGNGYYKVVKELISLEAYTIDNKKIKFNINTHTNNGWSVFFKTIMIRNSNNYEEQLKFIDYLLEQDDLDLKTIRSMSYGKNNQNISKITCNPFSFALFNSTETNSITIRNFFWEVVKKILKKKHLGDFYVHSSKLECSGEPYGFIFYTNEEDNICIDNVWIFQHFPRDKIEWLVEHGRLDMKVGYKGKSKKFNVRTSLHMSAEEISGNKQKIIEEMDKYQRTIDAMNDEISKLQQLERDLIHKKEPYMTMMKTWEAQLVKKQAKIDKINQTLIDLTPLFDKNEIKMWEGGRKRSTNKGKR